MKVWQISNRSKPYGISIGTSELGQLVTAPNERFEKLFITTLFNAAERLLFHFNMSELWFDSWLISQHATTLTLAVKLVVIYLVCLAKPQWRIIDNKVYSAAVRNIQTYMHNWS